MSHKLRNYLRTYRKRAGLSQDEMAFLLGCQSGTKVSRYERYTRQPSLQTAFVYEVVFRVPARELFAGMFQEVENTTLKRAQVLARKLAGTKSNRRTAHKLKALSAAASRKVTSSNEQHD